MELSHFLAKLIGLYLLLFAGLWVLRKKQVDQGLQSFISSKGLILFAGSLGLLSGLAIAIGHPVWQMNWRGLISLLGIIMIIQGIVRVAFIDLVQKGGQMLINRGFWPMIAIMVILGAFLTYCGFF